MKVLVVGAGNIGTTLANLLLAHQRELGIDEVLVQKVREPAPFDAPELIELERRGARIVRATTEAAATDLLGSVGYVFDCRKDGAAIRDRQRYSRPSRPSGRRRRAARPGSASPSSAV